MSFCATRVIAISICLQAAEQGWDLLSTLSKMWPSTAQSAGAELYGECSFPDVDAVDGQKTAAEAAPVIVGTVLNLLVCTSESGCQRAMRNKLLCLAEFGESLDCWLR